MNPLLQTSQACAGAGHIAAASAHAFAAAAMTPQAIGAIESEDAARRASRFIDYGSSYSLANNKPLQISAQHTGAISNPFARFNVPIGDTVYNGKAVTAPATGSVEFMADPDVLNVQPMFDPAIGAEKMVDPKLEGESKGMWAIDSTLLVLCLCGVGIVALTGLEIYALRRSIRQYNRPIGGPQPAIEAAVEAWVSEEMDRIEDGNIAEQRALAFSNVEKALRTPGRLKKELGWESENSQEFAIVHLKLMAQEEGIVWKDGVFKSIGKNSRSRSK